MCRRREHRKVQGVETGRMIFVDANVFQKQRATANNLISDKE